MLHTRRWVSVPDNKKDWVPILQDFNRMCCTLFSPTLENAIDNAISFVDNDTRLKLNKTWEVCGGAEVLSGCMATGIVLAA